MSVKSPLQIARANSRLLLFAMPMLLAGQQRTFTIGQAVQEAVVNYPAVRASLEKVASAAAGINLMRASYLPRADFVAQLNRATRNNVSGLLLPQAVIPAISGPVFSPDLHTSVWGSAVGVLVSWEPFDFGQRRANVETAEAALTRAERTVALTKLQVSMAAADAFLTMLAAQQSVRAAQAGVDRARVLYQVLDALVSSKLRPGADSSRMRAELAIAETQLIQAQQSVKVARAALAQFLNIPAAEISVESGPLLQLPPAQSPLSATISEHPSVQELSATIDEIKAGKRALDRSYFPRFNLQGATYARGTGSNIEGTTGGSMAGSSPNVQNWALGLNVTFPAFELPSLRARRDMELHRERSQEALRDQVIRELNAQNEKAAATLEGALRVAENTPFQLEAARASELQGTARYKAGLGTIIEVVDAQRLLTQAEIDDSLACLGVWRAMLAVAAAAGDLDWFIDLTRQ
jgi:outer membrane protein